jgi:hypothetical protein
VSLVTVKGERVRLNKGGGRWNRRSGRPIYKTMEVGKTPVIAAHSTDLVA